MVITLHMFSLSVVCTQTLIVTETSAVSTMYGPKTDYKHKFTLI